VPRCPLSQRYRKEATGTLDEVQVAAIRDRLEQLKELDKRREAILKSIEEQGKLTPELKKAIDQATIPTLDAKIVQSPSTTVQLEGNMLAQFLKLVDAIEDNDDVQHVWHICGLQLMSLEYLWQVLKELFF